MIGRGAAYTYASLVKPALTGGTTAHILALMAIILLVKLQQGVQGWHEGKAGQGGSSHVASGPWGADRSPAGARGFRDGAPP